MPSLLQASFSWSSAAGKVKLKVECVILCSMPLGGGGGGSGYSEWFSVWPQLGLKRGSWGGGGGGGE